MDLWDHKGPLIYYINALGLFLAMENGWGVWFIQILWLFFTALLAYKVLSKLTGEIPAFLSTFLLCILIGVPLGGGNYTEEYALLPLFLCWFGFQKFIIENEHKWLWLVGISTDLAFLLRPNLISGQIAVSAVILFLSLKNKNTKYLFAISIGVIFILVPVLIYFYCTGALYEMYSAAYIYNRFHHIGGSFDVFLYTFKGLESYRLYFGIVIFSCIFAALNFLESLSQKTQRHYIILAFLGGFLIEIWLSNLAPYQFKHYYILWAAYFSVFSVFLFAWLLETLFKFLSNYFPHVSQFHFAITLLIFIVIFISNKFATTFQPDIFIPRDNPINELLAEIKPYSDCCSYLLVWGAESQINFALDKESPSRFFYQYALFSDGYVTTKMINEFLHDIAVKKPLIIDTSATNVKVYPITNDSPNLSGRGTEKLQPIRSYVANNYYPIYEMTNGWIIYSPNP